MSMTPEPVSTNCLPITVTVSAVAHYAFFWGWTVGNHLFMDWSADFSDTFSTCEDGHGCVLGYPVYNHGPEYWGPSMPVGSPGISGTLTATSPRGQIGTVDFSFPIRKVFDELLQADMAMVSGVINVDCLEVKVATSEAEP